MTDCLQKTCKQLGTRLAGPVIEPVDRTQNVSYKFCFAGFIGSDKVF